MKLSGLCLCLPLILGLLGSSCPSNALSVFNNQKLQSNSDHLSLKEYDLIVCGAGASGMFAAGTAASFGAKTLLLDQYFDKGELNVGGDCSNAACVPSKALRSATQFLSTSSSSAKGIDLAQLVRQHSVQTVNKVRQRETPERLAQSPNLDLMFVSKVFFQDSKTIELEEPLGWKNTTKEWTCDYDSLQVRGKKFIICTGSSPTIPNRIDNTAAELGVPILTYRSFFRPDGEGRLSDEVLWNLGTTSNTNVRKNIVVLGGGPSACEMAHTLGKLTQDTTADITIVAPTILPQEDVAARAFCRTLLQSLGIRLVIGQKAIHLAKTATDSKPAVVLEDGSQVSNVDLVICATGQSPGPNLEVLQLDRAHVEWNDQDGVICNSRLQSISAKHIFAAGDCASVIPKRDRRAAHAGWTGYHSVQSALFPRILTPMDCIHPVVPRVTALDPEIASVGLTHADCVAKYGVNGFSYLKVNEEGTDRADMDSIGRPTIGFIELRASQTGRILGATICLPNAPEIANELGLAIRHKMTCRDIAKSIHYYPSYGYLMHRIALALAFGNVWGMLGACGPVGRVVGAVGRTLQAGVDVVRKRTKKTVRQWQAQGARQELYFPMMEDSDAVINSTSASLLMSSVRGISFLEAAERDDVCQVARELVEHGASNSEVSNCTLAVASSFVMWLDSKPN